MIVALLLVSAVCIGFVAYCYDWRSSKVVHLDSSRPVATLDSYRIARHVAPAQTGLVLPQRSPPRITVAKRANPFGDGPTVSYRYPVLTPLPKRKARQ